MAETTRELMERAVYAALGCTDMKNFDSASKQIASFVIEELTKAEMAIYFIGVRQGVGSMGSLPYSSREGSAKAERDDR
jgi:hypothetical protein